MWSLFHKILILIILFNATICFSAEWFLTPKAYFRSGYDSNILYSYDNKIDDWENILDTSVAIVGQTEKTKLDSYFSLNIEKYFDHTSLDCVNSKNRVTLSYQATPRLSASISGIFEKDHINRTERHQIGVAYMKKKRFTYGFDADTTYNISERIGIKLSGTGRFRRYPNGPYPDSDYWLGNLDFFYLITPKDTLGISTGLAYADYNDVGHIRTVMNYIYWKKQITENDYFIFSLGIRHTKTTYYKTTFQIYTFFPNTVLIPITEKVTDKTSGIIYGLTFHRNWTERLVSYFDIGREHYNSTDARGIEHTYVGAKFTYKLTEKMFINCRIKYDYTDYEESKVFPSENVNHIRIAPFLSFNLNEKWNLSFMNVYEYSKEEIKRTRSTNRVAYFLKITYKYDKLFSNY